MTAITSIPDGRGTIHGTVLRQFSANNGNFWSLCDDRRAAGTR